MFDTEKFASFHVGPPTGGQVLTESVSQYLAANNRNLKQADLNNKKIYYFSK